MERRLPRDGPTAPRDRRPRLHRDVQTVRRYLRKFTPTAPAPALRPAPRPRRVVRWITTNPGNLTDEDSHALKEIRAACPELDAIADHVRDFAEMMRDLSGAHLPQWIERVEQDRCPRCTP